MEPTNNSTNSQPEPNSYHSAYGSIPCDLDLGIAIVIAEAEDGSYEVLGPVATINEGIDAARHDLWARLQSLDQGGEPMCIEVYRLFARKGDGDYAIAYEIHPSDANL